MDSKENPSLHPSEPFSPIRRKPITIFWDSPEPDHVSLHLTFIPCPETRFEQTVIILSTKFEETAERRGFYTGR